ncbi:MATE family efflux transporter [Brumimicrobium mesophilum]|uniref:MATE family efflux transporter n=1 Tax=Brumimicrobium mesophilum TaxID=392717 RepID=UPI000D143527|nr:MATE family efflux transporter [Brumimicrobium mesophilum]
MQLSISYKQILKVALPLMLGTFIQSIVMITDASFLSRYSTLSFDASGNAGLIYVTLFMGLTGLGDASQIIMARRIGQGESKALNSTFQSALFIIFCFAILFFYLIQNHIGDMLMGYSKNKKLAQEQIDFLSVRSYGFFMGVLMLALNSFFMATGKTWVIMVSTAFFATSNIILDYLLIFGFWGIEPMGVKGAALASVISEGLTVIVLLVLLFRSKERKIYEIFSKFQVTIKSLRRLLNVGMPLVIQGFFALATWTIFFTWIEQLSTYDLTVSQNIRAIYFLAFVPIFGFGATTKTYVAQYMDSADKTIIPRVVKRIQFLTMLFLLAIFHGALLYPEQLVSVINPVEVYIEDSAYILRMIFGSILIFGISTPYFQTINGSGNTRVSLAIEILAMIAYIIYAYFTIKVWNWSIEAIWTVEYLYFISIGGLSLLYLTLFNWRKKEY